MPPPNPTFWPSVYIRSVKHTARKTILLAEYSCQFCPLTGIEFNLTDLFCSIEDQDVAQGRRTLFLRDKMKAMQVGRLGYSNVESRL